MKTPPQPAKKSYFFGKGYQDLGHTIRDAWIWNMDSVRKYASNISAVLGSMKETWQKIALVVINAFALLAVLVCGSALTAILSAVNVVILVAFMVLIYVGFSVAWLIDRTYLVSRKIFTACDFCKAKSLIPTYICPNCGAKHTRLTPGVYGILHRKCICGEKLPTTFFTGRGRLAGECPNCGHAVNSGESRPLCIPVVGGRSVGKTAFITAFSHEFIENVAPANRLETEMYNADKSGIYREIVSDYASGSTRITERSHDVNMASSISFSFFVKNPELKPNRLIHIYDVAGEVFTDNSENEVQLQYGYCHGIVMIVDPFSIPSVSARFEGRLSPEDVAGIGRADINAITDSFLTKLHDVTGMTDKEVSSVPLAVVISKIDSAALEQFVGETAVNQLMRSNPLRFSDFYDTEDYLCRKFLKENDMANFVSIIDLQFKTNRFFSCSAIGHTRDKGKYEPVGVMAPMEWIFRNADDKLGELWHDTKFNKSPLKL